jgi:hypothetical protein
MRIVSPLRLREGNTMPGVIAPASDALDFGQAEQAPSRLNAAGQDPGNAASARTNSKPNAIHTPALHLISNYRSDDRLVSVPSHDSCERNHVPAISAWRQPIGSVGW